MSSAGRAFAGLKVMVIDDSLAIRRDAERFLVEAGCTVILALGGFEALAKINDREPDVIFLGILMPRLDGYQTCALIKKNARFARTPVIMLSSSGSLFDRARSRIAGSDACITKPFNQEALLDAIACCTAAQASAWQPGMVPARAT